MSDNSPPQPPPPSSTSNTTSNNTNNPSTNQTTSSSPNANNTHNESITSRLQTSATTLAQNLFTPSPADIARNLQPGGSSSTKAAPPSAAAQTFHGETAALGSSSARGIEGSRGVGESFRSTTETVAEQDGLMEEGFGFQNGHAYQDGGLESSVPFYEQDADIKGKGKGKAPVQDHQPFENTWNSITTTTTTQPSQTAHAHAHANLQDGSEVLTLLTSPSFNPDFPDPITTTTTSNNPDPGSTLIPNDLTDPAPFPLSAHEIQILESFRRTLSPDPTHGQNQQRINTASLIPDIDNFLSTVPPQRQNDATALRDAVLTGLTGAEEWVSVEERYQDEVWGFLKPVLVGARREMEERGEQEGRKGEGEDGPAVARLKMILRHMRA